MSSKKRLLRLTNDYVFRKIFGDAKHIGPLRHFLISFGCLDERELYEMSVIDPQSLPDFPEGKEGTLDVLARTKLGSRVHIEIQMYSFPEFKKRLAFYASGTLTREIAAGDDYSDIGRVISIALVDFELTEDDGRYHKVFRLREVTSGEEFSDVLELHIVELRRLPKTGDGALYKWLKMITSNNEEEIAMLATETAEMKQVYGRLTELSADESERLLAERREKLRRDIAAIKRAAAAEGMEAGIAKGMAKGRAEGRAEGMAKGRADGKFIAYRDLVRDGVLSARAAADRLSMSEAEFISRASESKND